MNKYSQRLRFLIALVLVLVLLPMSPVRATGELDVGFGNTNPTTDGFYSKAGSPGEGLSFNDLAKQDNKTILVGKRLYDLVVARLNADGTLDESFAGSGNGFYTLIGTSGHSYSAKSVAVDSSDGSIYVLGQNGPYDLIVIKLNSDGELDLTFDSDGILDIFASTTDSSYAFTPAKVMLYLNQIYVSAARSKFNGSVYQDKYFVARIDKDGVRSDTFETPLRGLGGSMSGTLFGMDIFEGTIYLSGNLWGVPYEEAAILTLNAETGGLISTPITYTPTSNKITSTRTDWSLAATDILVEPDGSVVTTGYIWDNYNLTSTSNRAETFLHKFSSDFSSEASNTVSIATSYRNYNNLPDVVRQSNGKYLVLSQYLEDDLSYNEPVSYVARLNADLILDTTFDLDGIYYPTTVGPALQNWKKIFLQSNQRLLIAGGYGDPSNPIDSTTNGFLVSRNKTATVPDSPIIGTATATSSTTANVTFTAPTFDGGTTIIRYVATSSPGGITGSLTGAGSGTISITGLSASTEYTFTITASNLEGESGLSGVSNSITTSALSGGTGGSGTTNSISDADETRRQQEAAAAAKQKQERELTEILSLVPSIAGLAQGLAGLGNSVLLSQRCVKGKKVKKIKVGAKCPKGYKIKR